MRVPFAIVLYLDDEADRRVREIWAALDGDGVISTGTEHRDDQPHVTLAVFDDCDPEALVATLREPLTDVRDIPLVMASIGFFTGIKAPAFLGVTPAPRLMTVHQTVQNLINPLVIGNAAYYQQANWMPHCTLAMGAVGVGGVVVRAVSNFELPIRGRARAAHLVRLPTRRSEARLSSPLAAAASDALRGTRPPPPPLEHAGG